MGMPHRLSAKYSYLPEGPTDPIHEARVLILKDEAGRKDKVFLYDSQGDGELLRDGRYSPIPKRVVRLLLVLNYRRTEIWKRLQSICTVQFHYPIKA